MRSTRRELVSTVMAGAAMLQGQTSADNVKRFVRFAKSGRVSYGLLQDDSVRAIEGNLFGNSKPTGAKYKLSDVKLLHPCEPSKILAVGLNYKSHLGNRTPPSNPEIFYKPISCLQHPEGSIVIPRDAQNVHYEGELVVVIGKKASNVSVQGAREAIFGVTCGNDVSERDWQNGTKKDLQWWRAKGADTFGPLGPAIVTGLDYGKLRLKTQLNGEVVQEQLTSDLLFDCPTIVSYVSSYVTLLPGDVIYTGTPGSTRKMKPGDVAEVSIENVGVLRNTVAAQQSGTSGSA